MTASDLYAANGRYNYGCYIYLMNYRNVIVVTSKEKNARQRSDSDLKFNNLIREISINKNPWNFLDFVNVYAIHKSH